MSSFYNQGYNILEIRIVKQAFEVLNISPSGNISTLIDIAIDLKEHECLTIITLSAKGTDEDSDTIVFESEFKAHCKFKDVAGIENPVSLEEFGRIHAPAITFPFLREALAGAALKAGIGTVIIQPINFFVLSKSN